MTKQRENDWNPIGEDVLADGKAAFDRMRETCPVAYADWRGWTLFKYADVMAVSKDTEAFSSDEDWRDIAPDRRSIPLRLDPPEHGYFRRMLNPLFRPDRIAAFEPTSREIGNRLLDPVLAAGQAEMVSAFANPYPAQSLCALLGWPSEDWHKLKEWSDWTTNARIARDIDAFNAAIEVWDAYIHAHLDRNEVVPGENVGAWLLEQTIDGERLTRPQITAILRLLLQAGHGTTTAGTGICIAYLAAHPEEQERLRQDPSLIATAVEEMMRFDNPLTHMTRIAKRDVTIRGRSIKAGEDINLNYVAANRDPEVFERADECILDRKPNRHMVFGTGIHTCLGAPFARMEIRVALEQLLSRTRHFRIIPGESPTRQTYMRNEYLTLPLEIS